MMEEEPGSIDSSPKHIVEGVLGDLESEELELGIALPEIDEEEEEQTILRARKSHEMDAMKKVSKRLSRGITMRVRRSTRHNNPHLTK